MMFDNFFICVLVLIFFFFLCVCVIYLFIYLLASFMCFFLSVYLFIMIDL